MKIFLFFSYQTLSDLWVSPKPIRNHFLLFNIHEEIAFLGWKCFACLKIFFIFPATNQPTTTNTRENLPRVERKIDEKTFLPFTVFGRMNGSSRMADGSSKIWITQFKIVVVFVLNPHTHTANSSKNYIFLTKGEFFFLLFSFVCFWCRKISSSWGELNARSWGSEGPDGS